MNDKYIIQGSRAQLKANMEKEYGKMASKQAVNQNIKNDDRVNAIDLAAILRAVYLKNKKKFGRAIKSRRGK
ncbi:MAG: hypothetical protein PQ612_08910 [Rickettsiales bacterium]|nr:hypothetical protein [Pseudomonadota bacterium]MDA0967307.1 hypothetical protein [Pseudomonadota bacterium]MDG4544032.1 hypothetical protein [Rickettsiales bacterium]MDG4546274.1 hypothetical protein [Rickettsiales bacterium]MDG4548356.1 hypothetical protein [Rickettsiales bacterium]